MKNEKIQPLRAHHLLCSVLFLGSGYSRDFVSNMTDVVERLKNGCDLELKTSPDSICSSCPNLLENGACFLDKKPRGEEIHSLDKSVLAAFGLSENEIYSSSEVYGKISKIITEPLFLGFCEGCRWQKEGYCNFSLYKKRLELFKKKDKEKAGG